jgi:DNA modification methylase
MKMLSWKDATVLDIFNGAGTTAVACEKLGRKYIGIEMSKKYCDLTVERIKGTRDMIELNMFAGV